MKGGAHPSLFAAVSFPNSKKLPIYCWVDEFFNCPIAKPSLELTRCGDFLHHSRAVQPLNHDAINLLAHRIRLLKLCSVIAKTLHTKFYLVKISKNFHDVSCYGLLFLQISENNAMMLHTY